MHKDVIPGDEVFKASHYTNDAEIEQASRRKDAGLSPFPWWKGLRRNRHVRFVRAFITHWLADQDIAVAAMRAARASFKVKSDKAAAKKGFDTLKRPDVCEAVERLFEEHGFSFSDIVETHIKHIKGMFVRTRAIVVKDGKDLTHVEMVEESIIPNYTALRDLENLIIHRPPQKFEFDNVTKDKHIGGVLGGDDSVPEMATDAYPLPKLTAKVERDGVLDTATDEHEPQDAAVQAEGNAEGEAQRPPPGPFD